LSSINQHVLEEINKVAEQKVQHQDKGLGQQEKMEAALMEYERAIEE